MASREAERIAKVAFEMMGAVIDQGAIPEIVIGAKSTGPAGHLDYVIVGNPHMTKDQMEYVLRRVLGLIDGTIKRQIEGN